MPIPKVRGIPNIGNTCYQNAALQLLIAIPEFTDFVEKTNLSDQLDQPHMHMRWLQKLFAFVRQYRSNPNDQEMLESLRDYYSMICLTKRVSTRQETVFRRGRQADTQEVYDTIIQTLVESYSEYPDHLRHNQDLLPQIHPFISYLNIRYAYCYYLAADLEKQIPKKLSTRVVNQNMFFIPLAIGTPSPSTVIELSKLITEWRVPENEYKVDVNPRRIIKQISQSALHHMGKYFFIRLGREDPYSDGSKIDNRVIMPHLYNFRALLDDDPENNNKHCYALIGIIHHYGQSLNRGHYTASILSDGQWILCDDSDIRPHTPSEIKELAESSTGYIYLYQKLDGLSTQSADRFLPYGDGLNHSELVFTTPDYHNPYSTHSDISPIVGEEFERRFGGLFGDDSESLPPGFD